MKAAPKPKLSAPCSAQGWTAVFLDEEGGPEGKGGFIYREVAAFVTRTITEDDGEDTTDLIGYTWNGAYFDDPSDIDNFVGYFHESELSARVRALYDEHLKGKQITVYRPR
jgi:hypothetical protein